MTTPPLLMIAEGRRPRPRRAERMRPLEISLHMSIAGVLRRFARPEWKWAHYPAGEHQDIRTAAKLKAMGVQRGWADFLLFAPDGGRLHALELKRVGEDLSGDQKDFRDWCFANQVPHAVAKTVEEALAALNAWGCLRIKLNDSGLLCERAKGGDR